MELHSDSRARLRIGGIGEQPAHAGHESRAVRGGVNLVQRTFASIATSLLRNRIATSAR